MAGRSDSAATLRAAVNDRSREFAVPWESPDFDGSEFPLLRAVLEPSDGFEPISRFEAGLGSLIGSDRVLAVNNGTLAILCALLLEDIQPGDRVLVPTYTFASVVNTILLMGGIPVLVDSDPAGINMDLDAAEDALRRQPGIVGILFVDVGGVPPDLARLGALADRYGVWVIEDGAEALGSEVNHQPIGTRPHITTLSFQRAKQLTTLEGGGLVLPTDAFLDRARLLRNHGMGGRYEHIAFGLNFRLGALEAAVGLAQLPRLDGFIQHRGAIIDLYRRVLGPYATFQAVPATTTRMSWALALVRLASADVRDALVEVLARHGVETRVTWKPVHRQPFHRDLAPGPFPVADGVFQTSISLPLGNGLDLDQAAFVASTALDYLNRPPSDGRSPKHKES